MVGYKSACEARAREIAFWRRFLLPDQSEQLAAQDLGERVRRAIDQLDHQRAAVLSLLYGLEGVRYSPEAAAKVLGLPLWRIQELHQGGLLRLRCSPFTRCELEQLLD